MTKMLSDVRSCRLSD